MFSQYMKNRNIYGFINIYLDNPLHNIRYKEAVHILFDPLFTIQYQEYEYFLHESPLCLEIYNINEGYLPGEKNTKVMFVFKIPDDYIEDYHYFLNGDYSKFSDKYKSRFKPGSLPHRVITQDSKLKKLWEKRLKRKLGENDELYGLWKPENEIYNYKQNKNESKNY